MPVNLYKHKKLIREIVLCDGVGRSGKGMISHIIGSFKNVELQKNDMTLDHIHRLYTLKLINLNTASYLLNNFADESFYNSLIGRNINFRPSDDTSIFKNADPSKYVRRLYLKDGLHAVNRSKKFRYIFTNAPHEALGEAGLFFNAFSDRLKFIYSLRNPLDLIVEWNNGDFGNRIGNDPREFQLTFKKGKFIYPIYVLKNSNNFRKLNQIEKCVVMIDYLYRKNIQGYKKLPTKFKKRVKIINFEDLVFRTNKVIPILEKFLNTKKTKWTKHILNQENCPRDQDLSIKPDIRVKYILSNCKKNEIKNKFKKLINYHDNFSKQFLV